MNRDDVRWRTSGVAKLEFMAQEEIVTIIPVFRMQEVNFLSGRYGPFEPPHPAQVPLWLAMLLKESRRCKIVTPDWLGKDNLQAVLKKEKEEGGFQPLPFHYVEMARLLCRWRGDVKDCTEVECLITEIESIRDEKIRRGVAQIKPGNYGYSMASLTAMEVNTTRSVMTTLMNTMTEYDGGGGKERKPPPVPGDLHAVQPSTGLGDEEEEDNDAAAPAASHQQVVPPPPGQDPGTGAAAAPPGTPASATDTQGDSFATATASQDSPPPQAAPPPKRRRLRR